MRIIDPNEFKVYKNIHLGKIKQGAVFIYPTDTIYGVGCDATNGKAIEVIRKLKNRPTQPFSIIAPSIDWIKENCDLDDFSQEWLNKLPGPYTFIFRLKNKEAVHSSINKEDGDTIGVRIPNHWISDFVKELGFPIVTTAPNKHGEEVMRHPNDLDVDFRADVHFTIFEGMLHNPPSTIVKLTDSEHQFLRGKAQ